MSAENDIPLINNFFWDFLFTKDMIGEIKQIVGP